MKTKLMFAFLLSFLLSSVLTIGQYRGNTYSTEALQWMEDAFNAQGTIVFPNYAAAPYVCGAGYGGGYYYNTATNDVWYCDGTAWTNFGIAVGAGSGTLNSVVRFGAGPSLVDSTVTDDGTDVLATGGLITSGTAVGAADSILVDGNNSGIVFEGGTLNAFETTVVANDPTADLNFHISNYNAGGTAQDVYPVVATSDVVIPYAANSMWFEANSLLFAGGTVDNFEAIISAGDFLGAMDVQFVFNLPAAGTSGNVLQLSTTVAAMDAAGVDVVNGFEIGLTNANHTGGTLNGLNIPNIVGDAQATEVAIQLGTGWDRHIQFGTSFWMYHQLGNDLVFNNAVYDILRLNYMSATTSGAVFTSTWGANPSTSALVDIRATSVAMDNNDTEIALKVDFTNANHSGANNIAHAVFVDDIVEDPDAFETGVTIGSGFDSHITLKERGGAFADTPPAGYVSIFLDDNADWSGAGGNDCALVAQTSGGATVVIATIVLNGVCP